MNIQKLPVIQIFRFWAAACQKKPQVNADKIQERASWHPYLVGRGIVTDSQPRHDTGRVL